MNGKCQLWTGVRCESDAKWSVVYAAGTNKGAPVGEFCVKHVKVYRRPDLANLYNLTPIAK